MGVFVHIPGKKKKMEISFGAETFSNGLEKAAYNWSTRMNYIRGSGGNINSLCGVRI